MKSKRHLYTLVETLIAFSLVAVLLASLLFFYQRIQHLNRQMEREREVVFQQAFLEQRLSSILPRTVSSAIGKKKLLFSGNSQEIFFTFDNENCLKKTLATKVIASIYFAPEKGLLFQMWPNMKDPLQDTTYVELLRQDVENVVWEFYGSPQSGWSHVWDAAEEKIPSIIRITLHLKSGEKEVYSFPIPEGTPFS